MENLKDKKNNTIALNFKQKSRLNSDMISNLFFQLRESKYDTTNKKKKTLKCLKDKTSKAINLSHFIIKKKIRNTIMNQIGYVYNESNKEKNKKDNIEDELFYMKKKTYEKINREYFPIHRFNNLTQKSKTISRNLTDYDSIEKIKINKYKTEINEYDEPMIPTTNHFQIVELRGIKNQTYGIRYDNKPNYFSFKSISLKNENNKIFNNFNNYLMRNNFINSKKHCFKI